MKLRDLIRHLEKYGCELLREGGSHSVFVNRKAKENQPPFRDIVKSTIILLQKSAKI